MMTLKMSKKSCLPGHSSSGIFKKEINILLFFLKYFLLFCTHRILCSVMARLPNTHRNPTGLDVLWVSTVLTMGK